MNIQLIYDGTRFGITADGQTIEFGRIETRVYLEVLGMSRADAERRIVTAKAEYQLQRLTAHTRRTEVLMTFIAERAFVVPGEMVTFAEFYDRFVEWLPDAQRYDWTKPRVSRSLPMNHPSGASPRHQNRKFVANLSWTAKQSAPDSRPLTVKNGRLTQKCLSD